MRETIKNGNKLIKDMSAVSPRYAASLSLWDLVSEQYGRRSFTSIMLLLVLLANIEACCATADLTEINIGRAEKEEERRTGR